MQEHDIAQLQKEIALRGRIIEALVNGNEEIRERCSLLVSFINQKQQFYTAAEIEMLAKLTGLAISENGKGLPNPGFSLTEKGNGLPESGYSATGNGNGQIDSDNSSPEIGKGRADFMYSTTEKWKGKSDFEYSFTEKAKAHPELSNSLTEKGKGVNDPVYSLPEKIDAQTFPYIKLRRKIRAQTGYKGRESAMRATALLLVHLYNGGAGGYPVICKVCNLSEGGMGKMLMRLTKKGLIKRTGIQTLVVTETSRHLLGQALSNLPEQ